MSLIVFDKDGTLIASYGRRPANTLREQVFLPGVLAKCARLRAAGHTLAVASNQGGVAYGILSRADARALVRDVARRIGASAWRCCPHHPGGRVAEYTVECNCRKPKPGMILDIMYKLGFERSQTIYIGDQESDAQAAAAAGVRFISAHEFFGGRE